MKKLFSSANGKFVYQNDQVEFFDKAKIDYSFINQTTRCPITGFVYSDLIQFYLAEQISDSDFFYQLAREVQLANPEIIFDWIDYFLYIELKLLEKKHEYEIERMGYYYLFDMMLAPNMWQGLPIFEQILQSGDGYNILSTVQQFQILCLRNLVQAKMEYFWKEPELIIEERDDDDDEMYNLDNFVDLDSGAELDDDFEEGDLFDIRFTV